MILQPTRTPKLKMAEGILFNIVEKILVSLGRYALQDVLSTLGARRDLEKLEGTIRLIRARVHDAEKRHEQERSEVVKEWLGRLRQVLYRADDLFDEVYTISCRQQRADRSKLAHQVHTVFSSSNPFGFNRKMAHEIKSIRKELDDLKSEMDGLNFRVCLTDQDPITRLVVERETVSFVQTDRVIGRDRDRNNILDMLFHPKYAEESVSVIPIVGFGGLGKTTLAQLVFNDQRVKKHFDIAKWACVPEISDPKKVLGEISSALTGVSNHDLSKEQIQSNIRVAVKDKKFLLVLDDIWDESRDRWLDILSLLQCGNRGSKIIVTTRSGVVATIVGTVPEPYKLGLLTKEESWKLFKILAFKNEQEESNPTLAQIGKEIVGNCGNVPLAIRVVGSVLYAKHTEKEWELFRDAQVSKAKLIDLNNIMPVLKLSYDYLPSVLKRCFAYCSLFPKDYMFRTDELVRLWMAQGYLESEGECLSMEDVGDQYFLELVRRNFFQDVKEYDESNIITCKMHDLVHDLAQHVAGDEICVVDGLGAHQYTNRLVHVHICALVKLSKSVRTLHGARNMRSLLFKRYKTASMFEELVSRLKSLRAVEGRYIKIVPASVGRLTHLQYLNFSHSRFKYLPNAITRLDNLKTLNLDFCRDLKELPRGFTKLVNLRHLGITECPFTDLPPNFGKLNSLTELNRFIIAENNGIDSLGDLDLRGELKIEWRRRRTNGVVELQAAKLKDKKKLISVSFCFQYLGVVQPIILTRFKDEELLLESLHLPPSLIDLHFSGLVGNSLPRGMLHDLPKLVSIFIHSCDNFRALPLFSRFPLLKHLRFAQFRYLEYVESDNGSFSEEVYFPGLDYVEADDDSVSDEVYFPALETLSLCSFEELKRWSKTEHGDCLQVWQRYVFPRLRRLEISRCPKLMSLPFTPRLESLTVSHIDGKLLKSILTSPSASNKSDGIRCLSVLEELKIDNCEGLDTWDENDGKSVWEGLKSLRTLKLSDISKLESLPRGIGCLSTLENLIISGLPDLKALPQQINGLSQLQSLAIINCWNLTSLPRTLRGLKSLQKLRIYACPALMQRCQQPDGDYWPRVQHIPTVSFHYV